MGEQTQITVERWERTCDGGGFSCDHRALTFVGEELTDYEDRAGRNATSWDEWTLYRTRKGRLVVERYHGTRWIGSRSYNRAASFADLAAVRANGEDLCDDEEGSTAASIGRVPEYVLVAFEDALGLDTAEVVE